MFGVIRSRGWCRLDGRRRVHPCQPCSWEDDAHIPSGPILVEKGRIFGARAIATTGEDDERVGGQVAMPRQRPAPQAPATI